MTAAKRSWSATLTAMAAMAALSVLAALLLPIAVLVSSVDLDAIARGTADARFWPAMKLSLWTSTASTTLLLVLGTPLAWQIAMHDSHGSRLIQGLVTLPIVVPPAVIGVALLQTFGRDSMLGPLLARANIHIPFTSAAVVIAQSIVAAPFFVQSAVYAFRSIDRNMIDVARSLGASAPTTFMRVVIPLALPGIVAGAALAWARALGEFGATLLFAGNAQGVTQTLPLAIYSALESDIGLALVFSVAVCALAVFALLGFAWATRLGQRWRSPGRPMP